MSPGGFVIRGFGFNSHRFRRIRVQGLGFRDLVQVAGGRVFLLFMYEEVWGLRRSGRRAAWRARPRR